MDLRIVVYSACSAMGWGVAGMALVAAYQSLFWFSGAYSFAAGTLFGVALYLRDGFPHRQR